MKDYIEERAIDIANYIIDCNATVRQTARQFGISKSTVHMVVIIWNGLCGGLSSNISVVFVKRRLALSVVVVNNKDIFCDMKL